MLFLWSRDVSTYPLGRARNPLGLWQLGKAAQHLHNQVRPGSASARNWRRHGSRRPCCLPSVPARLEFEKVRQLALQIAEENQAVCASCLLPRRYVFRRPIVPLLQDELFGLTPFHPVVGHPLDSDRVSFCVVSWQSCNSRRPSSADISIRSAINF